MPEDRKQPAGWPLYFTPMAKNPKGRLESLVIIKASEETIGRIVKDQYRMDGEPMHWYPDGKLQRRLPDLPGGMGPQIAAAREVVVEHYIAVQGNIEDDPPDPPAREPGWADLPDGKRDRPAAGDGTIFDDL